MKSNMKSARMRRNNRRIQFQEKAIRETQARAYEQPSRRTLASIAPKWFVAIWNHIYNLASSFFRSPFSSIRSLNLLHDMTMGPNQHRAAGANKLREWFLELGSMVSTRDGKRV